MALRKKTELKYKDHELDVAELEVHKGLMPGCFIVTPDAAGTTNAADQKDLDAVGAMANPVSPDVPRNIKMTVTDADDSITYLKVTVLGTDILGRVLTEIFYITAAGVGKVQAGNKIFATLTSITVDKVTGGVAADKLDFGWSTLIGVPAVGKNFAVSLLLHDGTAEAATAEDEDAIGQCYFTPTTAPNGTVVFTVWYAYSPRLFEAAALFNIY